MAFAGNMGMDLDLSFPDLDAADGQGDAAHSPALIAKLFTEELGIAIQVTEANAAQVVAAYTAAGLRCADIGVATQDAAVSIKVNGNQVLAGSVAEFRDLWEATSFELDALQAKPSCVAQEKAGLALRTNPQYFVPYVPSPQAARIAGGPKVAVIREEGSNGDREMCGAFHMAGFEVWDVTVTDMVNGRMGSFDAFQGMYRFLLQVSVVCCGVWCAV